METFTFNDNEIEVILQALELKRRDQCKAYNDALAVIADPENQNDPLLGQCKRIAQSINGGLMEIETLQSKIGGD